LISDGNRNFVFITVSIPATRPVQAHIERVFWDFSPEVKWPELETDYSPVSGE
jgi:hypothetical protein